MSLINQSGRFLNSRFRQQITVKKQSGTHSASGFDVRYETLQMIAIVIPTSPNDVLLLPEGERYLPSVKVYTQQQLSIGDLMEYRGETYKIKTSANWGDYGYYNNIGVRHSPTSKVDSTGFTVT
nr:MAG TPA: head closure knob [Caudoviricetes sp.]